MGKGSCRHKVGGGIWTIASWLIDLIPPLIQVGIMKTKDAKKEFLTD